MNGQQVEEWYKHLPLGPTGLYGVGRVQGSNAQWPWLWGYGHTSQGDYVVSVDLVSDPAQARTLFGQELAAAPNGTQT